MCEGMASLGMLWGVQTGYSRLENAVRTTITRKLRTRKPKSQRKLKAASA